MKILFLLKKRHVYIQGDPHVISSGLKNSATFVANMLKDSGEDIKTSVVEVGDGNDVNREVTSYRPNVVVIEALWVTPEKLRQLVGIHPGVKWVVRIHSEYPFLVNEGIASEWIYKYLKIPNVLVAPNSNRTFHDLRRLIVVSNPDVSHHVVYLPNYYKLTAKPRKKYGHVPIVNVGCFGAVRPMKNHVVQALAAISWAKAHNKVLNLHINYGRIESNGQPALKNLRAIFAELPHDQFRLVEHDWLNHSDFVELVKSMDFGLQVSFSESFNIVAADFVSVGVPIIVSNEIDWMPRHFWANPNSSEDIESTIDRVIKRFDLFRKAMCAWNALGRYNKKSKKIWLDKINSI